MKPRDETPIVWISRDEDGDYIARDLTRKGLLVHGENEASALQQLIELRRDYDEMEKVGRADGEAQSDRVTP